MFSFYVFHLNIFRQPHRFSFVGGFTSCEGVIFYYRAYAGHCMRSVSSALIRVHVKTRHTRRGRNTLNMVSPRPLISNTIIPLYSQRCSSRIYGRYHSHTLINRLYRYVVVSGGHGRRRYVLRLRIEKINK